MATMEPTKLTCRICGASEQWIGWIWPAHDVCPGCGPVEPEPRTSNLEPAPPAHRGGYSGEEQQ